MPSFAGKPTCTCGAKWFPVFVEALEWYDIEVYFTQLIGSAAASAGTHGGGLCFDLVVTKSGPRSRASAYAVVVSVARKMGADATWHRPKNWDGRGGGEHVHGLGTGCHHLKSGAKYQQSAVKAGLNGLANRGKDNGPRPLSGRTWAQGITYAKEHIMALSSSDIEKIATLAAKKVWEYGIASRYDDANRGKKYQAQLHLSVNNAGVHEIKDQLEAANPTPPKA